MGLLKQLMIFGKSGLQGLPTRVALFPWAFSRRGATGFPLLTTWDSVAGLGRAPIPENISGRKLTRVLNSAGSVLVHLRYVTKRPRTGEGCDPGNSGFWERDYGWGVRVHRHFGARGKSSVRYGTRLGDLKNKQPTEITYFKFLEYRACRACTLCLGTEAAGVSVPPPRSPGRRPQTRIT